MLGMPLVSRSLPGQNRREMIALDSNVVTYLVEAMTTGYDPESDDDDRLRLERISAMRVFLYVGNLFVTPTVIVELRKISELESRQLHELVTLALLGELVHLDQHKVERRTQEFLSHHSKEQDCRILAEGEAGGVGRLLTFDSTLVTRLQAQTNVRIATASTFWEEWALPQGAPPRWEPVPTNPLATQDWWRW